MQTRKIVSLALLLPVLCLALISCAFAKPFFSPLPPPSAAPADFAWVRTAPSNNVEAAQGIAVDSLRGAVYAVGKWNGGLQGVYGDGTGGTRDFTNTFGGTDAFVAKYDTGGALLWAFSIGGTADDEAYEVVVSPNSDTIFVCGIIGGNSTSNFAGMPGSINQSFTLPNSGTAGFVAAYDANGFLLWSKVLEANANNRSLVATSIAIASHGLYTTGYWEGPADFGPPVNNVNAQGTEDVFLLQMNPVTGTTNWMRRGQGTAGNCQSYDVAVDDANVYFTGDAYDDITLDGAATLPVTNAGESDIFIASYDPMGNYRWAHVLQAPNDDHGRGIAVGNNAVFLTGNLQPNPTFPGLGLVNGGNGPDFFLSAHDKNNGNALWQKREIGDNTDIGTDLVVAPGGDVFAVADLAGNTDFSGTAFATTGGTDFMVLRYETLTGALLNAAQVQGPNDDHVYSIACYQDSVTFIATSIGNSAIFTPLPLVSPGFSNDNIAISRNGAIAPPGWDWVNSFGSPNFNCANSVALDTANSWVYVGGTIRDSATFSPFIPDADMNNGAGQGPRDGFLAKFRYDGTLLWVFNISSTLDDEVTGVTLGADGNVYVTGYSEGTTEFKGTAASANLIRNSAASTAGKIFVAGYNPTGEVIWANLDGGDAIDLGLDICANSSGLYVTGIYTNTIAAATIAGQNFLHPSNTVNGFVAKYDYAGAGQWLAEIGTALNDTVSTDYQEINMGIACFADSIYVIGAQNGTNTTIVDGMGNNSPNTLVNPFGPNGFIFIASFLEDGSKRWEQGIFDAGSGNVRGFGIDADCDGVYITGSTHNNSPFPSGALFSANHDAAFLAQLDHSTGIDQWILELDGAMGGNHRKVGFDVNADQLGNIFFTGKYTGSMFNSTSFPLPSASADDVYIFQYRNDGTPVDGYAAGGPGQDIGFGLEVDPAQELLFACGLRGPNAVFSPFTLPGSANNLWVGRRQVASGGFTNQCCNTPLSANAGADQVICAGDSAQLNGAGGPNYSWMPTTGLSCTNCPNPMASPAVTTTYILTVDDGNVCFGIDSMVITVNSATAAGAPVTAICAGDTIQLSASGGVSYVWTPGTDLSNPNIASPLAFPAVTTNFQVVVTDANSCKDSITLTVPVNPLPTAEAGSPATICAGDTAQLNAIGGGTYVWSPTDSLSNSAIANPMAFPAATTLYTVTVTDINLCTDSDTVTVTVNPNPIANAGGPIAICEGDTTQLQATGGGSYVWSPTDSLSNSMIANPVAFPIVTTTYMLTVSNANCTDTDTVTVTVNPIPVANAGNPATVCQGDSILLNGSGVGTYQWSPANSLSDSTIANPMAAPAVTTTYTLAVTNGVNCTDTSTVLITVAPATVATVNSPAAICVGDSAQLQAGGGSTYLWFPTNGLSNPNIADPKASPNVTTTYSVVVTNASNCSDTAMVTVTVNPLPIANAGPDTTICAGATIQLQASGGGSYSWSPITGLSNPMVPNPNTTLLDSITYIVTVTNLGGCSATDTINVNVRQAEISFLQNGPYCNNDPQDTLDVRPIGGTWTGPGLIQASPGIFDPVVAGLGSHLVFYTATDSFGCTGTDSTTLQVNSPGNVAWAFTQDTVCQSAPSVLLNSLVTGAPGGAWTSTTASIGPNDSLLYAASPVGTHLVSYTLVMGGCTTSVSQSITILVDPQVLWTAPVPICEAAGPISLSSLLQPGSDIGGTWSGSGVTGVQFDPTGWVGPVTVTYTVGNGYCDAIFSDVITVLPDVDPSWVNASLDTLCNGNQVIALDGLVTGTQGGTWSGTGVTAGVLDPDSLNGLVTVTYTVGIVGCQESQALNFFIQNIPAPDAGADTSICGDALSLSATAAGIAGAWDPDALLAFTDSTDPQAIVTAAQFGSYQLTWRSSQNGCTLSDDVTVEFVQPLPAVNAGPDQTFSVGEPMLMRADPILRGQGLWSDLAGAVTFTNANDPQTAIIGLGAGVYSLNWAMTDGPCFDEDVLLLTILEMKIPTGFSPNGDGTNDMWVIRGINNIEENAVVIFNRWGNEVYRAESYQNDWNGMNLDGSPLADDTYYFILTGKDFATVKNYVAIKR